MHTNPSGPGRGLAAAAARADFKPSPELGCPPIADIEVVIAARSMNLAGNGAAGAQMLVALFDDSLGPRELAQRVNAQPGIAVRVLRVANSAYYGQAGRVASVDRAARVLGLKALRGIATAACFDRMTTLLSHGPTIDLPAFRRHSLAAACAAQGLAERAAPGFAEEAFTAGMLHDLGIIVQWKLRPQWLSPIRADAAFGAHHAAADDDITAGLDDARRLLATHARCGRVLLETWRLPPALAAAVGAHDAPAHADPRAQAPARIDAIGGFDAGGAIDPAAHGDHGDHDDFDEATAQALTQPLTSLIVLADHLAWQAGCTLPCDTPPAPPRVAAALASAAAFGLTIEHLAQVAVELPSTVARLSAVFGD